MNWEAIRALGEILGAIAVLVTLVYLAKQIRHNTFQARLGSIQAINASKGGAEWFATHKHVFSDSCVKSLEKAIKE